MKNLMKLQNAFFAVILFGLTATFMACSSDDDDNTNIQVSDVIGKYSGEVTLNPFTSPKENTEGESKFSAEVTADGIKLSNLPFERILKDYINDEAVLAEILPTVEAVNYETAYTSKINEEKNGLELVIKADSPIAISYYLAEEEVAREDNTDGEGNGEEVENTPNHTLLVALEANAKGTYQDKTLNFSLIVTDVSKKEAVPAAKEETEKPQGEYIYAFSLLKK